MSSSDNPFVPSAGEGVRLRGAPGVLEISFLGVGAAFSRTMRQSNIIVVKGDTHLMIDMGTRASIALHEAGLSVLDIENLVVTHSHADHAGGVEEWCLKARYGAPHTKGCAVGEYKPNLFVAEGYARILWEETLRGGLSHSKELGGRGLMELADYVNISPCSRSAVSPRPVFSATVGTGEHAIDMRLVRTNHIPSGPFDSEGAFHSVAVLLDGRVLVSGDTMFDADLVETLGEDVEAIFHDCQRETGGVHASYGELSTLPQRLKRKMLLYHLPDGIREALSPRDDGFAGFAVDYREGKYVFG